MQSGARDRMITFQTEDTSRDAVGQMIGTWADIATQPTMWAEIYTDKGIERFASNKKTASQHEVFKVRYRTDIKHRTMIEYFFRRLLEVFIAIGAICLVVIIPFCIVWVWLPEQANEVMTKLFITQVGLIVLGVLSRSFEKNQRWD